MSATIIVDAAARFFILISVKPSQIENHAKVNRVVNWVSQNTLPIYLIHMIVLVTFTNGLFGIYLIMLTFILIVDVPVFTFIVFTVSAASVYVLKNKPYTKKLIG